MSDTLTKRRPKKSSGTGGAHGKSRPRGGGNKTSRVVNFCVHGPSRKIAAADFTPSKLIEVVRVGLPVRELDDLRASLAVPMEKLVPLLGISKATLHRRKALLGRIDHGVYS